jgi:DNA-binding transcriptional LysR family regulator
MELTWIDDFIALDRVRNFTLAAQQRCTTQSAFSRRIKSLEDWFGCDLFDRDVRPVTLTKSGEECKKRIYRLRDDMMDMRRISNLATSFLPDNAIVICTTNTIAVGLLPDWLEKENVHN